MRLYRLLLWVYPRSFRVRFGPEMTATFAHLLEQERRKRGAWGTVSLWMRTAVDALVSGADERLNGPDLDDEEDGMRKRAAFHIQQAIRSIASAPGYAAAFVLTLGLAIGVNSAVFSVVNGVLLRPLPFQDANRLVYVKQPVAASGIDNSRFSFLELDDYRTARTVEELVEFGDWEFTVLGEDEPHRAVGGLVTSNYFDVLGMRSAVGRVLQPEDDIRGAEPVMLMTDDYWERVFGRDPKVIGRVLDLENLSATDPFISVRVVGVLEPGLNYTGSRQPDFYVNYSTNGHYQDASMRDGRTHRMTDMFARMAPGATLEATRSELSSISNTLHSQYPDAYPADLQFGLEVVPWEDELTRDGRATFLFLMGTVGLILVLAAANVTNLTLTRLIRREGELATRAALGASRMDLRMHLTTENMILGLWGATLGVLLAYASRNPLVAYAGRFTVRAQEVGVDWTVLAVTMLGGVLLAGALAWIPALPGGRGKSAVAMVSSRMTDSRRRKRLQRGLVVTQLALSFTMLSAAGLLVRSLIELTSVDPGFRVEQILTAQTPTGPTGEALPIEFSPMDWRGAVEEIETFPGVRSAAVASWTPLSAPTPTAVRVRLDDANDPEDGAYTTALNSVSPRYFETLGIPLLAGRYFTDDDRRGTTLVAIVNESLARTHFGDTNPVGHRISFAQDAFAISGGPSIPRQWLEIVGVVADSREYGMDREGVHTYYRPTAQTTGGPSILVAYQGDATGLTQHVRDVIHGMDATRAVEGALTMEALVQQDVAPSRLNAVLFGSLSVLSLIIASLGVLGTLSFSVGQRVREFGVRMALGADRGSILRSVMGEGALLVIFSLLLGVGGAVLLGRFGAALLFEVNPVDASAMVTAAWLLGAVAMFATWFPAIRATRVQPADSLKGQ